MSDSINLLTAELARLRRELRDSEQRFRNIITNNADGMLIVDLSGMVQFANPAAERLLGRSTEDLVGRYFGYPIVSGENTEVDLFHAIDLPRTAEMRAVDTQWGDAPAHVVSLRDVTERKRAEAAEHEQRTLAEALRDSAAALNSTLNFEDVLESILTNIDRIVPNDCASILLLDSTHQYATSARLKARTDVTTPIDGLRLPVATTGNIRHMLTTGQAQIVGDVRAYDGWIVMPRLEWIRSHVGAPINARGRVVGFLNLYSREIGFFTARHRHNLQAFADQAGVAIEHAQLYEQVQQHAAELEARVTQRTAELERERQRLQAILDAAGESIVFTNTAGTIEYVNPALERLTGYTSAEMLGQTPRLWRSDRTPAASYEQMWRTILRGDLWHGELINRRKDGSLYDTGIIIAPLHGVDHQIIGFVGLQRDITRQKEVERLKDEFVANVSHELRTPLANVKLYLGMLVHGQPDKREQYLQTLVRESTRLGNLIENLLSLSQLDMRQLPITLTPIDVNQLIAQLVLDRAVLITERGLLLEDRLAVNLPPARANAALMIQIMSNLITNAAHYTPPGGVITLSTALRQRAGDEWIVLAVKDTGPGISATDQAHLFERFYRGEASRRSGAPGTGLGLAICREIAAQLGGEITVDSQPGDGAAFTVWLRPASRV